jgi:hypothetical protein
LKESRSRRPPAFETLSRFKKSAFETIPFHFSDIKTADYKSQQLSKIRLESLNPEKQK